jgi:phosphatidylglycerophosphatase A
MSQPVNARTVMSDPVHCVAFGFGAGLAPAAPGTFGTLVAIPFFMVLRDFPVAFYLAATAMLFAAGVYVCGESARRLGVHDHGGIVWDEVVGYLVTLTPVIAHLPGIERPATWLWGWMAAGFVLFRFFDIAKPAPVGWADRRLQGGFGIMADDLIAGLYAALLLGLAMRFAPGILH